MDMTNLTKIEKDYIEKYSFAQLNADEIAKTIGIKRKEIALYRDKTKIYTQYIQSVRNRYNNIKNKKNNFSSFKKFYQWFENQPKKCCYCDTSQENLELLFNCGILTSKKFNGTLHIERFDSSKPYSEKNCALACSICNNAKSDFISKDEFKEFFANAIQKYLNKKIGEMK